MIEVKNLTKKFGEFTAVDDISFRVEPGEIFAFLGPNGAGKTTTIKMLTTLLRPTSGQMLLNGSDPTKDRDAVRRSFGIVFQDPSLDEELTAAENLSFHASLYGLSRELRDARMKNLLDLMELYDRRNDFVKKFSGGMKRRLEIARGLLHHPKVLFLDEPTIGLDPQTRFLIWEHVKELRETEGVTVFLTTHYLDEAERVTDRVAVIDHGKIVAIGSVNELLAQTGGASLEEAYLKLTGRNIREAVANGGEGLRARVRARRMR